MDITFDGESVQDKFGIELAVRPLIPVASPRYTTYEVPGRNGALSVFDGYENVVIVLRFNYIRKEAKPLFTNIVNWLTNKKIYKEAGSDYFRILTKPIMQISDANNDIPGWCDFEIKIETEPFWYQDEGILKIEDSAVITNPSNEDAPVIIKVYGSGNCNVRINDNQMKFTNVQGHVTVDGILKSAYKNNTNQNNNMSGDYPVLKSGKNEIIIEGDADYVNVEKRWCWR